MLDRDEELLARLPLGHLEADIALALVLEHVVQTHGSDLVAGVDAVVVGLVGERQRDDALLLEVGLVDAGEGLADDDAGAEVPRLQGGVLAGRALAVVVLGDDEPLAPFVVGRVDLARRRVDGRVERVGRDVGQVALVLEPGPRRRDGVGRALALDLDEDAEAGDVVVGERPERLEEGEALRVGGDGDLDAWVWGLRRDLEGLVAEFEGGLGVLETLGRWESELLAVGRRQAVGHGVEGGGAGECHGGDDLGRGEEVHGVEVSVVSAAEVSVV
ncbi:hypothetical protein VP1G_11144 [Cytospora mali]|uniref:Uncharacterized protein n=1 Tax=Cytospora mali TaxID=578113 RepID=A0A194V6T9_CYTMA|nr:hypothetical protein VP1G_11144 [Valsa mali var. pyri (nom. inval.)]